MDLQHFKNMFLHFSQSYQNRFQTSCHFRSTLECIYLGNEKIGQFHGINPIFRAPFFSELDLKSRKSIMDLRHFKTRFCIFLKTIKMDLRLS